MPLSNSNIKLHVPFIGANNATSQKDYSNSNHALTFNGNAKISSAQSYYNGGSSLYLDRSASTYVTMSDSDDWYLGTGDFTIKYKFNLSSFSGATAYSFFDQGMIFLFANSE